MQAHPRQKVVRIFLFEGSYSSVKPPDEEPSSTMEGIFVTTTTRGAKKPVMTAGWCSSEDRNSTRTCGAECDHHIGTLRLDGKGHLILSDVQENLHIFPMDGDEDDPKELETKSLGADDHEFRLEPMPVEACKAEIAKAEGVSPALGEPLRKRLKPDQPFCYGRDYDAAHLAKHPEQVTVSIRVQRGPAELSAYAADNKSDHWPEGADVLVTLTTRNAAGKIDQKYTCDPLANQWQCVAKSADPAVSASCDVFKTIFLRRGTDGTMMLGNPNSGLPPIGDICAKPEATKSDDKVFRLSPLPLSACGP